MNHSAGSAYQPPGSAYLQWNASDLEVRTKSVEKTLEPLIAQVTTLVGDGGVSRMKKGRSKSAHVLSAAIQRAVEEFIERGEEIANENPDVCQQMISAISEIRANGDEMRERSVRFADDPYNLEKRRDMVDTARALLTSVTRLLILADMIDVQLLLKSLRIVEGDLDRIRDAQSQQDLMNCFQNFGRNLSALNSRAGQRQADLKDWRSRDEMAAARATLKKNSVMLLTASKAYVRHPELAAARANRDYALKQVCDALHTMSDVTQATPTHLSALAAGELAAALDQFDRDVVIDPREYNDGVYRSRLEEQLESIISGAALLADSSCTRDERRERIVEECNAVRQALQDLLSEYMHNAGRPDRAELLDRNLDHVGQKTRDLRKQLRRAVMDHVSDSFLETSMPLLVLIEAAKAGNERDVEEYAIVFQEHAAKLIEVSNLACSMSNNEDGIRMVRLAAALIERLCPQVINAARVLTARPRSKVAQENMEAFRVTWLRQVQLLTDAVDDITSIEDFLAVSEGHILEDVQKCVEAVRERDSDILDRTAGAIRGRCERVSQVVTTEMFNYQPSAYTDRVLQSVHILRDQVIINFAERVDQVLNTQPSYAIDERGFIHSATLVYDSVRDVRRAVLMSGQYALDDFESDTERDEMELTLRGRDGRSLATPGNVLRAEQDDLAYERYGDETRAEQGEGRERALMRALPEEDRVKIQEQVQLFRIEKAKLDREMARWNDSGNDIIIIAKQMCMIMMEMTDFTRGRGPLKTTMDVIGAAKKISEAGESLDKHCKIIAEQCVDSVSKKDLLAYLQRIALYCHQLNITSKVKADVQNISGELIVSGLDSATSLIQAAKNLMNAVVLAVKASYVASTKYRGANAATSAANKSSVTSWKMKAPEKKPLVQRQSADEARSQIRRAEHKKAIEPIKALSEFHS